MQPVSSPNKRSYVGKLPNARAGPCFYVPVNCVRCVIAWRAGPPDERLPDRGASSHGKARATSYLRPCEPTQVVFRQPPTSRNIDLLLVVSIPRPGGALNDPCSGRTESERPRYSYLDNTPKTAQALSFFRFRTDHRASYEPGRHCLDSIAGFRRGGLGFAFVLHHAGAHGGGTGQRA